MEDKIKQALKTIKKECEKCKSTQCENECRIVKILGDCIANYSIPEIWEV